MGKEGREGKIGQKKAGLDRKEMLGQYRTVNKNRTGQAQHERTGRNNFPRIESGL